ncbi:MAG: polyprenol monophosphomannose synthase [Gaiellaceae bacterium]
MRLVLCLPTYNERANLEPLARRLGEVLAEASLEARVLVIDDSSPDGTGELADRLSQTLSYLSVLHRPKKEGLGPAYIAGFRWALEQGAELVLQMDCDFSHDPADIPRLVEAAEEADLALGSRYVEGGGTVNWGRSRQAISRFGSIYARALLGVSVRDLTGGFKCYRREVLESIPLERVRTKGYAFQIETTYRALAAGFRVVEVPIVFAERRAGGSKMSRRIVFEAMVAVPELRLRAALNRL